MNRSLEVCLVALSLFPGASAGQAAAATAPPKSFVGTWEGQMNDLPGINLKIDQVGAKISGTVVFYFQERSGPSAPWHAAGETAVPLLSPHVEDGTLTFEVQHHKCHGCAELGPNARFRMQLVGSNDARLWNLSEATDSDPGLRLVRRDEATMAKAAATSGQPLQRGVSVEMAVAANATPMPAADDVNAWIVAVVRDGSLFFGTENLTPDGLAEAMKSRPRDRQQKLYIKADARASFASVGRVLEAGRAAGFDAPVLLTSQSEPATPGTIVPPQGLEVLVGAASSEAIVVQVLDTGESKPDVRVNGADVNVNVLRNTLGRMLANTHERMVVVNAAGTLRFAQVAHVIDICRGAGLKVAVTGPEV